MKYDGPVHIYQDGSPLTLKNTLFPPEPFARFLLGAQIGAGMAFGISAVYGLGFLLMAFIAGIIT